MGWSLCVGRRNDDGRNKYKITAKIRSIDINVKLLLSSLRCASWPSDGTATENEIEFKSVRDSSGKKIFDFSHLQSMHSVSVQYDCPCLSCWKKKKKNENKMYYSTKCPPMSTNLMELHTSAKRRRIANSWLQKHAHSSISSLILNYFFFFFFFTFSN